MTINQRSVPSLLVEFFSANPSEELSISDIVVKFGCTPQTARQALSSARKEIAIECIRVFRLKEAK